MLCCSLKSSGLRNKILIFFPRTYRQIRLHYVYSFCIVLLLKMLRLHLVFSYYYILVLCAYCKGSTDSPVTFAFKEYQYKDSPKNEMTFREFETACEQTSACSNQNGLQRLRCIRECVSPSCYRELYQGDPLEEGEIDVRLNSFKGCFIQRSGRTRN